MRTLHTQGGFLLPRSASGQRDGQAAKSQSHHPAQLNPLAWEMGEKHRLSEEGKGVSALA